jgi:hypothetical protein
MRHSNLLTMGIIARTGKNISNATTITIGAQPGPNRINVTSGTGYAGSTYTANFASGQWYADGVAISGATSLTYVLPFANEGKVITFRSGSTISNGIQMWLYTQLGSTLTAWFDAASSTNFTLVSSTNVSSWTNRANSAKPATQATSTKYPVYTSNGLKSGYNAVVSNGTSHQLLINSVLAADDQFALAVFKTSDTKTGVQWYSCPGLWGAEYPGAVNDFGWGMQAGIPMFGSGSTDGKILGTNVLNSGNPVIAGYSRKSTTGLITHYLNAAVNGTGTTTNVGTRSGVTANTSLFQMAGSQVTSTGSTDYWGGSLSDFIVLNSIPSDAQRQFIEGCAAWRWALQGSLPSGHPYKNGPPVILS